MRISIKSFWPAVIALVIATILFCLPGDQFPKEGWLDKIFFDKWVHVGLFAVLGALWSLPMLHRIDSESRIRKIFLWIAVTFVCYGIIIEFIQGNFIPYRSFDVADMAADAFGCGCGFLFAKKQSDHKFRKGGE